MKKFSTIILILCMKGVIFGQTQNSTETKSGSEHCSVTFSGDKWIVSHHESVNHKCNEIVIKNLPPVTKVSTPIDLNINTKGFYTLKKDPSVQISDEYSIGIEDGLTGQYYNLGTQDGYTFSVNRASRDIRFVMEIKKNNLKLNNGSTASLN